MKVRFWGVRGSIATPLTPQQVQAKITAAIQRVTPEDIKSPDARERFISELPFWINGTCGGNTACVEVRGNDGTEILLDAGTGLKAFSESGYIPENKKFNIIFSHFHWDHIQGLPFFGAAFNPNVQLNFYSGHPDLEKVLRKQQVLPYFPENGSMDSFTKNMNFYRVFPEKSFNIGDFSISLCEMNHPGVSYSYSFTENGKKFVYATDVELQQKDYDVTIDREKVFKDADCIVLDSQYTVEEAYRKQNWGHSAFCYAIDFAVHWGIKKLYLFHHEPAYDDKKLNSILEAARWYAKYIIHSDLKVYLAMENSEIEL